MTHNKQPQHNIWQATIHGKVHRLVLLGGIVFAAVAIWLGVSLLFIKADTSTTASAEAENGTVTTPATKISDASASNGQSVKFGAASSSPSGEAMPIGDLPGGWKQVFTEDFKTNATASTFDSVYANSWCGYDEGTGGKYYKIITASGGMQRIMLDGTKGAAGSYGPPATCWGGMYGKYTMRFKVTGAEGYGAAIMLWPTSNVWGDGEVDYPEGNFNGEMHMFQHGVGCTNCSANIASANTGKTWTSWHTTSVEWTPSGVSYYMDGQLLKTVTTHVPINRHRWTIQMARTGTSDAAGTFDVDWVTSYSYNP